MLEHRDKGKTILEWEKRTNLLPRSAGIKETICKLALGVTHTEPPDSVRKANASTKLSFIKILPDGERAATNFMNYGTIPCRKNNRHRVVSF